MKKAGLWITIVTGSNRRMGINLVDMSPAVLRTLSRIEPRILDRDFYDRSLPERTVKVDPAALLREFGDVHRPVEIAPGHVLPSEINKDDERLSMMVYGHPRHEETFVRWLEGAVLRMQEAQRMRDRRAQDVHERMDATIDAWFESIERKARRDVEDVIEVPASGRDWSLKWDAHPLAAHPLAQDALRGRIDQMASEQGCSSLAEFLRRRERTAALASRADAYVARKVPRDQPSAFYV